MLVSFFGPHLLSEDCKVYAEDLPHEAMAHYVKDEIY